MLHKRHSDSQLRSKKRVKRVVAVLEIKKTTSFFGFAKEREKRREEEKEEPNCTLTQSRQDQPYHRTQKRIKKSRKKQHQKHGKKQS